MSNFKSVILKRFFLISCLIMFVLAGLWFFQTNALSTYSGEVVEAQEKLARLKQIKLSQFVFNTDYGIEQLAQSFAFEKIEAVRYIKTDGSTALAK